MFARFFFTGLLLVATAQAQDFKTFRTSEVLQEGGRIDTLTVDTAKQRFKMVPPRDYILRVDEQTKSLKFEGRNGQTAIAILFTTNSPSALPKDDNLKSRITNAYPGAVIISTGPCRTRPPGVYFEARKNLGDNQSLMINHAFVPSPEGVIELIFRSNGEAYKQEVGPYNILVMSFQGGPKPPPK